MSYLNPLLAFGFDEAGATARARAGVCGFIVPDLPYDESAEFCAPRWTPHGLALIQMVTPVTRPGAHGEAVRRRRRVRVRGHDDRHHRAHGVGPRRGHALSRRRQTAAAKLPVCAGFGIRSREQVEAA